MRDPRSGRVALLAAGLALSLATALAVAGCGAKAASDAPGESAVGSGEIVLASSTCVDDTGLAAELIARFEAANPGYTVKLMPLGTAKALELGEQKGADVLLTHDPVAEEVFVADGYGVERREVMRNYYLLVGPASDPARALKASGIVGAMAAIAEAGRAGEASFVSRDDGSGTHKKELELWSAAGVEAPGGWRIDTGEGMAETLRVASNREAYALSDRATYLTAMLGLDLVPMSEKEPILENVYAVIVVKGAPGQAGAQAFADWIISPAGQGAIGAFGGEQYGEQLYAPSAGG